MHRFRLSLLASLLALASCNAQPDVWLLNATGVHVEIHSDPYALIVRDGSDHIVLRSSKLGEGYNPLGYTYGDTSWTQLATPGWRTFDAILSPWRDSVRVTGARLVAPELLILYVSAGGQTLEVTHRVQPSVLRVEVRVMGSQDGGQVQPPRAFEAAFETPPGEGFLGFGERFNRTNHRGMNVMNWAEEGGVGKGEKAAVGPNNPWPNGEEMTYYPVPFFISTQGYGFRLDSTWRSEFNLATDKSEAWRVWHIGPSLAFEVYLPSQTDTRPWPQQLVDTYTARTGRPMSPPAWAFGPRRRIGVGSMVDGVHELQRMRDLDLAVTAVDDAVHFLPAASEAGRESTLKQWTGFVRGLGGRTCGYFNGYFAAGESPLQAQVAEGLAKGYFMKDPMGAPSHVQLISGTFIDVLTVDFSSEAAVAWYGKTFQRAIDLGYSCWMYDFGEYIKPDDVASNGMTGEQFHGLHPVLYDKALHDAMEKSAIAGDWMAFARSGGAGSSKYVPLVWSGDPTASFEDAVGLPAMVRAGINMGLSGVPHWGSDIGGFKCTPDGSAAADGELLTRWIQMGSMGSNMQDQNACVFNTDKGKKADLWSSPEAQAAWKEYARLHTRLQPYLLGLAAQAEKTGAPVMRHMFFEHPDRPELASIDDAYYLGPSLLVAPVVKRGVREKQVLLPPGDYLDWRDRRRIAGGAMVTIPAPLDKLPLLLRDGAIVPLLDPAIDTLSDEENPTVIGPGDVADVWDVVAFISPTKKTAEWTGPGGAKLSIAWTGGLSDPPLPRVSLEAELALCGGCFLVEDIAAGLRRARIVAAASPAMDGVITAGGLRLLNHGPRRVRWDVYVAE